jgi:GT2 family glycosyltransferase
MSQQEPSTTGEPSVTAIVLNYDGAALLDIVIPSLERQTYPRLTLMIVDNGSTDGSVEMVREHWPDVRLVEIEENVGVARALNRGIEESDTELVALLNNDIELEPRWLEELVAALLQHPDAASASGKLLRFDRRDVIDAAGDGMRWSSAAFNRGAGQHDSGQFDRPEPVFSACAGAALYRRAAFEDVGPFDEDFFAYLEDIDWSLRAQLRGYASRFVPAAVAYHMRGATTRGARNRYRVMQRRNQIWLVLKNYPLAALVRRLPGIVLLNAGLALHDAREGALGSTLRGWLAALAGVPQVLRKRRQIQRSRRVGFAHLDAVVTPEPWTTGGLRERCRATLETVAPAFGKNLRKRN